MEPTQAKPVRRRRRWLIVAFALVLVSPSCNSRPGGTTDADRAQLTYSGLVDTALSEEGFARDTVSSDGIPLTSWRLRIAQLTYGGLKHKWERAVAWDQGENLPESNRIGPEVFCGKMNKCRVFAVRGEGSPWETDDKSRLEDLPASLILFVVLREQPIHWMEPTDLNVSALMAAKASLSFDDEIVICFADGQIWTLRSAIPDEVLAPFLVRSSAVGADRNSSLAAYVLRKHRVP